MAEGGASTLLTKELVYIAGVTNGCEYCIASHGAAARKKGMTDAMWAELLAVVGMANESNRSPSAGSAGRRGFSRTT